MAIDIMDVPIAPTLLMSGVGSMACLNVIAADMSWHGELTWWARQYQSSLSPTLQPDFCTRIQRHYHQTREFHVANLDNSSCGSKLENLQVQTRQFMIKLLHFSWIKLPSNIQSMNPNHHVMKIYLSTKSPLRNQYSYLPDITTALGLRERPYQDSWRTDIHYLQSQVKGTPRLRIGQRN